MRVRVCGVVFVWSVLAGSLFAQQPDEFSRKNTWTVFAEYSNTSSHILLGTSRQRKIANFGGAYARRILHSRNSDFSYLAEIRPVLFESDPLEISNTTFTNSDSGESSSFSSAGATVGPCMPSSGSISFPPSNGLPGETETYHNTCGRQWTFGQAFSPLGFKYSIRTRHPVQPFIVATLGYMYSSRPIPVSNAEAFNFIFNFGAGVEVFRSKTRSVSLECRYNHFSNKDTAAVNPGTDNVMFKASYSFGH